STVYLDERPDVPASDLDLRRPVRRERGLPIAAVVGANLVLADPTQPAMDLANRGVQSDVEVVDGERVVDVQKAATGSGRSKTQDFPIDPRDPSRDIGALGGQEVGARPRASQWLRQIDHVP